MSVLLQWCETQRDCNRLRLIDILVRPMQRLTKYSLLLKAVLKKTDDVSQKKDLAEMVGQRYFGREINLSLNLFQDKNVESLVRDVNSHMRQRQEQERLKNIIARIDSYEPIVSELFVWRRLSWLIVLLLHSRKPKMMNCRAYLPQPLI